MRRNLIRWMMAALALGVFAGREASAEVLFADDFYYQEPTKLLGPGGGFQRQDYGGGQNGGSGRWAGRWISVGNSIIVGSDVLSRPEEFPDLQSASDQHWALTQGGLSAQALQREVSYAGVPAGQTLYFAVTTRTTSEDSLPATLLQINAPGVDGRQIGIGLADGGFRAQLGTEADSDATSTSDLQAHRLVGKLEINAVGSQERLTAWLDPTGEETGGVKLQLVGDVVNAVSELGGGLQLLGAPQRVFWDDVAVGTSWQDVARVEVPRLSLQVDPSSGSVALRNDTGKNFPMNYYELLSPSGALDVNGWQGLDGAVSGDGPWVRNLGTQNASQRLVESNLKSDTWLASGQSFNLGKVFATNGKRDLVARVGTADGLLNLVNVAYATIAVLGDFNGDSQLTDVDVDLLTVAILQGGDPKVYDLNGDNLVNGLDHPVWVRTLKKTWYGDANLDGEFNTTDFVQVFQVGEYEDAVAGNSGWAEGDWNADRDFNSGDFIAAFQDGGFEQGPRAALAASVPEPSAACLAALVALGFLSARRRS